MNTIILASSSPARKEILEKIGLSFQVEPSGHDEDVTLNIEPHLLARKISSEKAMIVARSHKNAIVIAADTFGVFRGKIIGKPHTEVEARKMLAMLSGKSHRVITGFTIINTDNKKTVSRSIETKVLFKQLTPGEIDAYIRTGEPLNKAGGYAIQGFGSLIVEKIAGDYYNVIGMPLSALAESLKEFGIDLLSGTRQDKSLHFQDCNSD